MTGRKWVAIDAEGDVGGTGLLGVSIYADGDGYYLTDFPEIRDHLIRYAREGYTMLAHNAEYDLSVIFWQLDLPMKAVYYNGRFNRGEWKHNARKPACQLWDTMRLSGGLGLAALGDALGMPKYATPRSLLDDEPSDPAWYCPAHNRGECVECYAVRDAEIVWYFMVGLTETLSVWGVSPRRTLSGLAGAVWRALDTPEPIGLPSSAIARLARKAYHGGRTECYQYGSMSPLYTADFQSMYPSVMLDSSFPDPTSMIYGQNQRLDDMPWQHEGVADVEITVPPMHVPPLPHVSGGELRYPIGTMRGVWTLAELRYAMQCGCTLRQCYQIAYGTRELTPFTMFVSVLWEMRQAFRDSTDPRQMFAKLLMNNLYGRMGMKPRLERQEIWKADVDTVIKAGTYDTWYTTDAELYLTKSRNEPHQAVWCNVLWAAQITAIARNRLHAVLQAQGSSLAYCDTDSVFSTSPISGTGDGLGVLQADGEYRSGIIVGPKLYALETYEGRWQAKARGIPRDKALAFLRTGYAKTMQPIKPRSQSRRQIEAGTWVEKDVRTQNRPPRRNVLTPESLALEGGWSGTTPPWSGRW